MRILVIGLDTEVAKPDSRSAQRQKDYFRGMEVDIVLMAPGGPGCIELSETIRVYVAGGTNRVSAWFRAIRLARKLLRQNRADVVTVQDPFFSGLAGLIARWGLPPRLHVQDHSGADARKPLGLKEKILFFLSRFVLKAADRVRTVSQRGRKGLERSLPTERIDVVPVASDVSRFFSLPEKTTQGAHLLCISRLSYEKGLDVLIRALPMIREKYHDVQLTIVGDGPERGVLERLAQSLGVEDAVQFVGAQKEVTSFLQDADVYVQPSRFEGWGIAVIEAAAAAKPIVMTDVGCAGEVIVDGQSGCVVPPQDERALAKGILRLLVDPQEAQRLGAAARKAAEQLPTIGTIIERLRASLRATAEMGARDVDDTVWIFFTALALRVVVLFILVRFAGIQGLQLPDTGHYLPLAENLIAGNGFTILGEPFIYRTIGYPLFLAAGLWVSHSLVVVSLLQCVLSSFAVPVVMAIGRRLGMPVRTRRIAGWLTACEPHLVYYAVPILTEGLFILPFLGFVYAIVRFLREERLRWAVYAGIFLGVSLLIKPLLQAFPGMLFALLVLAAVVRAPRFVAWLKGAGIMLCVAGIIIFPWLYRNHLAVGKWSLSSQGQYAMATYLVPSIVSVRDQVSYQQAEATVKKDLESRFGKNTLEGKDLSAEYSGYAFEMMRQYPLIFLRIAATGAVSYWTSHNYAYVPHFYHLTPPLDKSVLPPTHYLVQGRFADFAKGFWTIFQQPFYAIGAVGRLLWAIITVLMCVGMISALRRGTFRAGHVFVASIFVYSTITTIVNGLGIEGRLRYHIMPLILLYAAYGWHAMRRTRVDRDGTGMRLLLLTQRVDANDTNLSAHVTWLRVIAGQVKQLTVIAQSVGTYDLPSNVRVLSLGKEKGTSKFMQMMRLKWFEWREVPRHNAVLVLMVPMYVLTLGVLAWILRKPVYLWYTHKHVSGMLRAAMVFVRRVFTASKESFRLATPSVLRKIEVTGHAIDTEFFVPVSAALNIATGTFGGTAAGALRGHAIESVEKYTFNSMPASLVSVGRISRTKRLDVCIRVIAVLRSRGADARLRLVGDPIFDEDKICLAELHRLVDELKVKEFVSFEKGTNQEGVREIYRSGVIALNASTTGSLDKSILEAMSCGCLVVTSNEAFRGLVPGDAFVQEATPEAFTDAVVMQLKKSPDEGLELRKKIIESHQLTTTLQKVVKTIQADLNRGLHSDLH